MKHSVHVTAIAVLSSTIAMTAAQAPVSRAATTGTAHIQYAGVAFATPAVGWLTGGNEIFRTNDGGLHFKPQYHGTLPLQNVVTLNAKRVVAWGQDGAVMTSDGGQSWSALRVPGVGKEGRQLSQVRFISPDIGFASTGLFGAPQALYRTADGGAEWRRVPLPRDAIAERFANATTGWAIVSVWGRPSDSAAKPGAVDGFYRTTDAGAHWIRTQSEPAAAWSAMGATIYPVGLYAAYAQVIGGAGMSQSSSTLFRTTNGVTWTPVLGTSTAGGGPAPGVGQRKVAKGPGYDAGPVAVIGSRDLRVVGGMEATGLGEVAVTVSNDGGARWRTFPPIPGASGTPAGASALSFVNPDDGWLLISNGETQTLLRTTDGGAKWRKV